MLDEQADDGPRPLGEQLKALREARGLTLDEVSAATNVQAETLKAIEADTIITKEPATYARGFVRIYAEYLEADLDRVMEDFDRLCHPEQTRLYAPGVGTMSHKDYRPGRRLARRGERSSGLRALVIVLVLVVLAAAAYVSLPPEWFSFKNASPPVEPGGDHRPAGVLGDETPVEPGATEQPPVGSTARFKLVIIADRNAEIKAEVDGKVVFNTVLGKGKSEVFLAQERIRIELPDASIVRVFKDGEPAAQELAPGPATITYSETGFEISSGHEGEKTTKPPADTPPTDDNS